jgi:PRTRC genetic system ThiF family protein
MTVRKGRKNGDYMIHHMDSRLLTRAVRILLVGAGGTGSHVLRRLATIHQAWVELGHPEGLDVIVIDPDVVSKTNVGRQNFYPSDVGHSKAEILVNRCNLMMQTKWKANQEKVDDSSRISNIDLVIGCVDNRRGRAAILNAIGNWSNQATYYMDIGNREHDGQVILGQVAPRNKAVENRLPHVADLFPEIIDTSLDDKDETPSCSLAEALEKQSLFINDTMANTAMNMLWELFRYGQISQHGQFVNIKSGRITPLVIDFETWKRFGYELPSNIEQSNKKAA